MSKNKLPGLVVFMILTLITVVFWVLFNIYRSFTTTNSPVDVDEKILMQITPKLDTETIKIMKTRINP